MWSRQERTSALILFRASLLIAGRNDRNSLPFLFLRFAGAERVSEERERGVLVRAAPLAVLAVHDPGLVRVQPQPDLVHPVP